MRTHVLKSHGFIVVSICLVAAIAGRAMAQEKIDLKLNLKKGDQRKTTTTMEMSNKVTTDQTTLEMKMAMGMEISVDVKDVAADGVHTMALTFDRLKMKVSGPLEMEFDSANKDQQADPFSQIFRAMTGATITVKMNSNAKVIEVLDFDKLAEKLGVPKGQLRAQNDQMTQMLASLPDKPVGIGDSWEGETKLSSDPNLPMTLKATYTLVGREAGEAIVKLSGTIENEKGLKGQVSGTMRIDEQTGWTKSGTMNMTMKGEFEEGVSMDMNGTYTFKETPEK